MNKKNIFSFVCLFLNLAVFAVEGNSFEMKMNGFYSFTQYFFNQYANAPKSVASFSGLISKQPFIMGDIDYYSSGSYLLASKQKMDIKLFPLSVGPFYSLKTGRDVLSSKDSHGNIFTYAVNDSPYVNSPRRGVGVGRYEELGVMVELKNAFFFDVFANYNGFIRKENNMQFIPTKQEMTVNEFNWGASIGLKF